MRSPGVTCYYLTFLVQYAIAWGDMLLFNILGSICDRLG